MKLKSGLLVSALLAASAQAADEQKYGLQLLN